MRSKPNILLIMTDQQRYDTVSAYGLSDVCKTPRVDALAAKGIRFNDAFTPTAICSPARACFYTGVLPHRNGVENNGGTLNDGVRGLNHYLDDAGYRSGYAGKWHVDEERGPSDLGFAAKDFIGYAFPGSGVLPGLQFNARPKRGNPYAEYLAERGFDPAPSVSHRFVGTNPSNQQQEMFALHEGPIESCIEYFVAEETIRLIDELGDGDEPFFIWTNFWGPHSPSLVPEPYFSMYDPDSIPEHPSYVETFENKPYRQRLIERLWGLGDYGWRGFQEIGARYFGHCTLIDDMVGRIIDHLASMGIDDETMVIFTADHGDCMGAHRLIEKGEFMYDEIYRIPLIVSHPACRNAGVCDEFVYLHDLMPTILEAAETEVPTGLDGESLLPAVLGDTYRNGRDEVFGLFNTHFTVANQRMVRTQRHQFTFNSADQGELYDLVKDPHQLVNVYGRPEYESIRIDLMERLYGHLKETGDPVFRWYNRIRGAY